MATWVTEHSQVVDGAELLNLHAAVTDVHIDESLERYICILITDSRRLR